MSTTGEQELEDGQEEHTVAMKRSDIRALEKRAKEATNAQAEAEAAKRELAFLRAGIPEDGVGKLFRKAYDGQLDAESLREAAQEYGVIKSDEPSDDEMAGHTRMANASSGAPGGPVKPDIAAALAAARNSNEVMAVAEKYNLTRVNPDHFEQKEFP